jgi:hypothetical protein
MSGRLQGFCAIKLAVLGVVMKERPCILLRKSQKAAITETCHTGKRLLIKSLSVILNRHEHLIQVHTDLDM